MREGKGEGREERVREGKKKKTFCTCLNNDGRTLRRHWSASFPALHPFKYSSLQTPRRKIWESSSHTVVSSSIRDRDRKQTHRGQCLTITTQIWHYLRFFIRIA